MRIRNQNRSQFGRSRGSASTDLMRDFILSGAVPRIVLSQSSAIEHLESFIENQVQRRLDCAKIARTQAPIHSFDALLLQNLAHTVETILISPSRDTTHFRL